MYEILVSLPELLPNSVLFIWHTYQKGTEKNICNCLPAPLYFL